MTGRSLNPSSISSSNSDSFFGLALAQAFLGFAYGPVADQIWDAGEAASAIYSDRQTFNKADGPNYVLGRSHSLATEFARSTRSSFAPVRNGAPAVAAPSAPSLIF